MKKLSNKIVSFEPIRVLAMLGVLLYHLNAKLIPFGYLGVVTLFVLAGYLSMHHVMTKKQKPLLEQITDKLSKLFPPLIIMIAIVSVIMILLFPNFLTLMTDSVRSSLIGFNNYQQLLSGDSYFEGQLYLKPFLHLWALSLEIQFYLFFILLISQLYNPREKQIWSLIYLVLSILSIVAFILKLKYSFDPTMAYYSFSSRFFSFGLGMIASLYSNEFRRYRFKEITAIILFILIIVGYFINSSNMAIQMVIYSLAISLLLLVSHSESTFLNPLGELSLIQWLSSRSYYLYLWHYPIIVMGNRLLANVKLPVLLINLILFLICLIVAELFYQFHHLFRKNISYSILSIVLLIGLFFTPFTKLYELRAEEDFKQLEAALSEPAEPENKEPEIKEVETDTKQEEPQTEDNENVITLSPSATKDDFQESFIEYFNQLNQISPTINYSFDEFLKYRDIPVTLIGDSVAYMSQPHFESYLPQIITSAEKSRLLEEVDQYYFELKEQNKIQDILVLSFGTNTITESDEGLVKIWEDLNGKPMILVDIVMPYPADEESRNNVLHQFVETHDNVYLASWYDYAKTHPEFFAPDYMHPNDLGARAFIHLITNKVIEVTKILETNGTVVIQ